MTKLTIGFNYYFPTMKYIKDDNHTGVPDYWDMKPFCDWILNTKILPKEKRPRLSVPLLNQEFGNLEWRFDDSSFDEQHNLYYIRLKKLRSSNLPAISPLYGESEDVNLEENQFLGEFNLLVFDPTNQRVIVQSNYFGLSQKQVALVLTSMRIAWKNSTGDTVDDDNPGIVGLEIIPDSEALRKVDKSGIYRSFDVRASDIQSLTGIDINSNTLNRSLELAQSVKGVTFNVQVGLSYSEKDRSLDQTEIRNLIADIQHINNLNDDNVAAQLSVKARETVDDPLENINVLLPKLKSYVNLSDENRRTLAAEYIYNRFIEDNYLNDEQHFQQRARITAPIV